jgi:phosphatidylserine/phosphatidylglycerophosphate/cardiolipin synthase-like enzyme
VELGDWFLGPGERGNRATHIARRRPGGAEYTGGNHVEVLIDGATYYSRLAAELRGLGHDDAVRFTDWQGDSDELLDGPGTAIGDVLAEAAGRGVEVRGLLWRSHPRQTHFAEQSNARLAERVNGAGGEVVLDERVRRGGSHHQKLVVMHRPGGVRDVAFVGGIDLCHGRRDDGRHAGDPQAVSLDDRYGARPPWHDVQLEVRGPAVADLAYTFWERWQDPTPLDHRNPFRRAMGRLTGEPRRPQPMPEPSDGRIPSRPKGSGASRARISRRSAGRGDSSTSRTNTSGRHARRARWHRRCGANHSCGSSRSCLAIPIAAGA